MKGVTALAPLTVSLEAPEGSSVPNLDASVIPATVLLPK